MIATVFNSGAQFLLGGKFYVHGPHDLALEHEAHGEDGYKSAGRAVVLWTQMKSRSTRFIRTTNAPNQ